MKKWNIKKVLIIISIIIIGFGIILGISLTNELFGFVPIEKFYVDGSDFSGLAQIVGTIVSLLMGITIIFYSIFIDIVIWIIYGVVLIIIKIVKKIRNKNDT